MVQCARYVHRGGELIYFSRKVFRWFCTLFINYCISTYTDVVSYFWHFCKNAQFSPGGLLGEKWISFSQIFCCFFYCKPSSNSLIVRNGGGVHNACPARENGLNLFETFLWNGASFCKSTYWCVFWCEACVSPCLEKCSIFVVGTPPWSKLFKMDKKEQTGKSTIHNL